MSIKTLAARIQYQGGDSLGRINKQKLNSLKAALTNDYNSRLIKTDIHEAVRCLINENNLKPDYDKKIVSVPFSAQLEPGDVFECLDDNTHWMIYLPKLTETAYLQSEIIRCRYQLTVDDEQYWIYFQGPTETDLRWQQKNKVNYNELNLSGTIFIKNTKQTKEFFHRFTRVKLDGHTWEIQVTDPISVPGILELEVQEYYDNSVEELPEILREDTTNNIQGKTTVKQDTIAGYKIKNTFYDPNSKWKVVSNPRVKLEEVLEDGRTCKVRIFPGAIGTFTLQYGNEQIEVFIDWEKPIIKGPETVYPYDVHTYFVAGEDRHVAFRLNSDLANIIEVGDDYCKVEITSSKTGQFVLECKDEEDNIFSLDVTIKSL